MLQYQESPFTKYLYNNHFTGGIQNNLKDEDDSSSDEDEYEEDNFHIGGYPIQLLIPDTNTGHNDYMTGGVNSDIENLSRFTNLIVPAGLVLDPIHKSLNGENKHHEYETSLSTISDEMFDKIFDLTATIKSQNKNKNTKKQTKKIIFRKLDQEKTKAKTKKQKQSL